LESQVGTLLAELSDVQTELLSVLQQSASDLPPLTAGLAALPAAGGSLDASADACRRRELLRSGCRRGRPGDSLGRLVGAASGAARGKLGEQVKHSSARMRLLQHHSLANWVLAQRCLLHVSQLLEIIATGGRMQPTYGDKDPVHSRGALVNHEA
jgi:hypothetical protein